MAKKKYGKRTTSRIRTAPARVKTIRQWYRGGYVA